MLYFKISNYPLTEFVKKKRKKNLIENFHFALAYNMRSGQNYDDVAILFIGSVHIFHNNKAFRNSFCNPQKSFHTSPTRIIEAVNHSSKSTIAFTKKFTASRNFF